MIDDVSFAALPVPAPLNTGVSDITWATLADPSHPEQGQIVNAASAHSLRYIRDRTHGGRRAGYAGRTRHQREWSPHQRALPLRRRRSV